MRFILATNLPNEIIPIYLSCEISFSYFTGIVSGLFLPCRISQGEHEITLMFISRQVFSCSQTPDLACSQTPDTACSQILNTACSQTPVWEHTWIRNSVSGKGYYSLSHDSHVASRGTPAWESLMNGLQSWGFVTRSKV